jgi:hypothetical protein
MIFTFAIPKVSVAVAAMIGNVWASCRIPLLRCIYLGNGDTSTKVMDYVHWSQTSWIMECLFAQLWHCKAYTQRHYFRRISTVIALQGLIIYAQLLGPTRGALTRVYGDYWFLGISDLTLQVCVQTSHCLHLVTQNAFSISTTISSSVGFDVRSSLWIWQIQVSDNWQLVNHFWSHISHQLIVTPLRRDRTSHVALPSVQ